jgi:dipeptidyl aminopeptidase/acylaminoacyl peptidase
MIVAYDMQYTSSLVGSPSDRGKTVELVLYPREGHGSTEYYHQLDRLRRQYEWITTYTLGDARKATTQ